MTVKKIRPERFLSLQEVGWDIRRHIIGSSNYLPPVLVEMLDGERSFRKAYVTGLSEGDVLLKALERFDSFPFDLEDLEAFLRRVEKGIADFLTSRYNESLRFLPTVDIEYRDAVGTGTVSSVEVPLCSPFFIELERILEVRFDLPFIEKFGVLSGALTNVSRLVKMQARYLSYEGENRARAKASIAKSLSDMRDSLRKGIDSVQSTRSRYGKDCWFATLPMGKTRQVADFSAELQRLARCRGLSWAWGYQSWFSTVHLLTTLKANNLSVFELLGSECYQNASAVLDVYSGVALPTDKYTDLRLLTTSHLSILVHPTLNASLVRHLMSVLNTPAVWQELFYSHTLREFTLNDAISGILTDRSFAFSWSELLVFAQKFDSSVTSGLQLLAQVKEVSKGTISPSRWELDVATCVGDTFISPLEKFLGVASLNLSADEIMRKKLNKYFVRTILLNILSTLAPVESAVQVCTLFGDNYVECLLSFLRFRVGSKVTELEKYLASRSDASRIVISHHSSFQNLPNHWYFLGLVLENLVAGVESNLRSLTSGDLVALRNFKKLAVTARGNALFPYLMAPEVIQNLDDRGFYV